MHPLELAKISKCLSVETRIRLLRLIKDQSLCVGALAKRLGITPGAVSQHLRVLKAADLIIPEKRGYFMHYQINQRVIDRWVCSLSQAFGREAGREYGERIFPISLDSKGEKNV
ncbi:ArsR/SmtB family transcription factor [Dethiosulfatarculus sandiegensis]|nr:metalloregulator ArsR/SmtB family transcription factor [Dethiosulfatarculus sandiegensis]